MRGKAIVEVIRKARSKKTKANQMNPQKAVQVQFNALELLNLATDVKEGQPIQVEGATSIRRDHETNFTIDNVLLDLLDL